MSRMAWTGVVGPNGCGKSNLVEALRWVMGEGSHKSMRASGMDDVIFSGTATRPARNVAEVTIIVDNAERLAPAGFNDCDVIEVSPHGERGSTYRINGREVRARDVQLLFADASTGRPLAGAFLVRSGPDRRIINSKPQARRLQSREDGPASPGPDPAPTCGAEAQGRRGQSPPGSTMSSAS